MGPGTSAVRPGPRGQRGTTVIVVVGVRVPVVVGAGLVRAASLLGDPLVPTVPLCLVVPCLGAGVMVLGVTDGVVR